MKNIVKILLVLPLALLSACTKTGGKLYEGQLQHLDIKLDYPGGYEAFARQGVDVKLEEINNLVTYFTRTDAKGCASVQLPSGLYRISVSDRVDNDIFNGTLDRFVLDGRKTSANLALVYSKAGTLLIKEIYCGGCKKLPEVGDYQADQYIMIHNNDVQTQYLDSLCFGTLAPYNSNASNPWGGIAQSAPVIQALWQFGGRGDSFPLKPGEDAVLCLRGAIDHTVQYPLSVDLNREGYFVCYNNTYFTNPAYHPVPGSNISLDRYLDVVVKVGQANAYTFSINSPTVIIFRPQGMSVREFVAAEGSITPVPGSSADRVVMVPWEWIIDGVEVFNGSTTSNAKRIRSDVDAGFVTLSETFMGHSVMRHKDQEMSDVNGFEVLKDSNNSSADFYERETASLHHDKE